MGVVRLIALLAALSSCGECKSEEPRGLLGGGGLGHQLGGPDERIVRSLSTTPTYTQQVWTRYTILTPPTPTAGADGVDYKDINGDGLPDVVVPHEQASEVTVSINPGAASATGAWTSYLVSIGSLAAGVEDAKIGDFDGDGHPDIVAAGDVTLGKVYISFQNPSGPAAAWTTFAIDESLGHNHWIQCGVGDIDRDGDIDILCGGRVGSGSNPAVVAWFENPGAASARTSSAWHYHFMTNAGWIMSAFLYDVDGDGDLDALVSDRTFYQNVAGGTHLFDLYGARWIENQSNGATWVNHQTEVAGSVSNPANTPGDEKFMTLYDWDGDGTPDIIDGTSADFTDNRVVIHHNTGWFAAAPWANQLVTRDAVNAGYPNTGGQAIDGQYEAVTVCDVDGDGKADLLVSSTETNAAAFTAGSSIIWVRNLGGGVFAREEVLGSAGSKVDNMVCADVDGDGHPDIIANEQLGYTNNSGNTDQLGTFWMKNPYPSF